MTMKINGIGLACPGPVLKIKEALEQGDHGELIVLVDNEAAKENVSRFFQAKGFEASARAEDGLFIVQGYKSGQQRPGATLRDEPAKDRQKIMVLVATDRLGFGDEVLGGKLLLSFIQTLKEMGPDLWRLVFVNNGVKLTVPDSDVLPILQTYEQQGLQILVCGTCLTHFDLLQHKRVGQTTNMLDIVTAMQLADKVISI